MSDIPAWITGQSSIQNEAIKARYNFKTNKVSFSSNLMLIQAKSSSDIRNFENYQ